MKLQLRLLLSHLLVGIGSILVVGVLATLYSTTHEYRFQLILGTSDVSALTGQIQQALQQDVSDNTLQAFLLGGGIAAALAVIISLYISRRIVKPIRAVVNASRYIATGHYTDRLTVISKDELGELAQSFNQMAEVLNNTEQTRQQLLTDLCHEMKTPLSGIKAYMEGLNDGVIPPTAESFEQVTREADRLQRLVLGLQELSLVTEGAITLHPALTSATHLVEAAAARLRLQYDAKGVALTTNLTSDLPLIQADAERIEQVLVNLLGNSLQYTEVGGAVTVSATRVGDQVCFAVRDTGVGIAPHDLERIFQRFYRVDKSRSRNTGGSGIGLTIARHLVEAHSGRLWAESPGPDQGSTFYFTLPTTAHP